MANAWASQGARKTGPLSSRGMPGTSSAACRAVSGLMDGESGMFEIRLKSFDGDFQLWIRVGAPKFPGIEAHRVKPLRILTLAGTDRVGKDMSAVQPLDHTDPVARIARQARMRRRVNVLRAHAVAGFEAGRLYEPLLLPRPMSVTVTGPRVGFFAGRSACPAATSSASMRPRSRSRF